MSEGTAICKFLHLHAQGASSPLNRRSLCACGLSPTILAQHRFLFDYSTHLPRVERLSNFGTVHWRLKLFMAEKKTKENQSGTGAAHAQSPAVEQKPNVYEAEYMGSGTFRIVKPKRKEAKRRQSRLKGTTRGSRK